MDVKEIKNRKKRKGKKMIAISDAIDLTQNQTNNLHKLFCSIDLFHLYLNVCLDVHFCPKKSANPKMVKAFIGLKNRY